MNNKKKDEPKVTCCPHCGKENITQCVEWFAHSMDEQDLHNTAELTEFQCQDCALSFWVG